MIIKYIATIEPFPIQRQSDIQIGKLPSYADYELCLSKLTSVLAESLANERHILFLSPQSPTEQAHMINYDFNFKSFYNQPNFNNSYQESKYFFEQNVLLLIFCSLHLCFHVLPSTSERAALLAIVVCSLQTSHLMAITRGKVKANELVSLETVLIDVSLRLFNNEKGDPSNAISPKKN